MDNGGGMKTWWWLNDDDDVLWRFWCWRWCYGGGCGSVVMMENCCGVGVIVMQCCGGGCDDVVVVVGSYGGYGWAMVKRERGIRETHREKERELPNLSLKSLELLYVCFGLCFLLSLCVWSEWRVAIYRWSFGGERGKPLMVIGRWLRAINLRRLTKECT